MTEQFPKAPKDPSDSAAVVLHGLTATQVEKLFGEQGEFASLESAWTVLWQKAQFAAQWLSSYWTADIPEQVLEAGRVEEARVAAHRAEWEVEDPESLQEYLEWEEKTLKEQAEDENIVHDRHPLMGCVMTATTIPPYDESYQLTQDIYKAVCDIARLSVTDESEDDKAMVEYAISVLDFYGAANWSSNNKEGVMSRVEFPSVIQKYTGYTAFYPSEDRLF